MSSGWRCSNRRNADDARQPHGLGVYSIGWCSYDDRHMKRFKTIVMATAWAVGATCLGPVQSAMALDKVGDLEANSTHWMSLVIAILLVTIIGTASFKSSKRTHLD